MDFSLFANNYFSYNNTLVIKGISILNRNKRNIDNNMNQKKGITVNSSKSHDRSHDHAHLLSLDGVLSRNEVTVSYKWSRLPSDANMIVFLDCVVMRRE